ncbi:uncharacterized protein TNCV_5063791 [Trichonephila clavipes]|nr:uncharacterized protein TNCV_5063791 [Trichonephila clavipes]
MKTAPLKKVFNAQPIGTRRKGRTNLRWIDGLEKDLLVLRTKNWRTPVGRMLAWKRLLEKAKAHPGLSNHRRRKGIAKETSEMMISSAFITSRIGRNFTEGMA